MPSAAKKARSAGSNLVSFRLPPPLLRQLDVLANGNEESRGDCAKRLVIESLSRSWLQQLEVRFEATDQQIEKLREDVATTVAMMLVSFGKQDPVKVEAWVKEHLLD